MFIGEGPGETEDQTGRLLCLRESFLNDYYEIIQKKTHHSERSFRENLVFRRCFPRRFAAKPCKTQSITAACRLCEREKTFGYKTAKHLKQMYF